MIIKAKTIWNNQWIKGYYYYNRDNNQHFVISLNNNLYPIAGTLNNEISEMHQIFVNSICRYWIDDFFENDIVEFPHGKLIIKYGETNMYILNYETKIKYYGFYLQPINNDIPIIEDLEYFLKHYKNIQIIGNKFDN